MRPSRIYSYIALDKLSILNLASFHGKILGLRSHLKRRRFEKGRGRVIRYLPRVLSEMALKWQMVSKQSEIWSFQIKKA